MLDVKIIRHASAVVVYLDLYLLITDKSYANPNFTFNVPLIYYVFSP